MAFLMVPRQGMTTLRGTSACPLLVGSSSTTSTSSGTSARVIAMGGQRGLSAMRQLNATSLTAGKSCGRVGEKAFIYSKARPFVVIGASTHGVGRIGIQHRGFSLWPSSPSSSPSQSTSSTPSEAASSAASPSPPSPLPDVAAAQGHGVNEGVEAAAASADQIITLSDLDISGWPNVRLAQSLTDWVVESTGLPWWANIALVTIGVRILIMPLVLRGQTNSIRMANIQPRMKKFMADLTYARSVNDQRLTAESAQAIQTLMKENDVSFTRSFLAPAVQAPIFISFFFALRSFAEQGLTSMKTGGLLWFPDLTMADPNSILPVLSAASMLLVIETGAELGGGAQQNTQQAKVTRNVMRGVSVIAIPFIWNFPAAVFCYWLVNNFFSLAQLIVLQLPAVRRALKIPPRLQAPEEDEDNDLMPAKKQMSFWDSFTAGKDSQTMKNVRPGSSGMPSVLRDQRMVEEARERALQRMMRQTGTPSTRSAEQDAAAPQGTPSAKAAPLSAANMRQSKSSRDRAQATRDRRPRPL